MFRVSQKVQKQCAEVRGLVSSVHLRLAPQGRRKAGAIPEDETGYDEEDQGCAEADAEGGAVRDGANDLWRECVAKTMDEEEVETDGGGTNRSGDRVDNGSVERAGIEEEEEFGGKESGDGQGVGAEEKQRATGQGEGDTPEREQVKGAVVGAEPALRDPAAGQGSGNAINDCNSADGEAGITYR